MFSQVGEKCYVQSEATEVCEFRTKNSAFSCRLQRRFPQVQGEKFFSNSFFLSKSEKNWKLAWNSFVCFTVVKVKCRESAKLRKGKNRTRRKLLLCFLSELLCLPFKVKLKVLIYSNRPFYLNSFIFNCAFRTNS